MLGEHDMESDEEIGLSEAVLDTIVLESLSTRPPLLSDQRPHRLMLRQAFTELLSGAFSHHGLPNRVQSDEYHNHITQPSESVLQVPSNEPDFRYGHPAREPDHGTTASTRDSGFDARLEVLASAIPGLHSASEIHEHFSSLNLEHYGLRTLPDQRQTLAEVIAASELVELLDATNFLEGWGREYVREPTQIAPINLKAIRALRHFERPLRITARDLEYGMYDLQGINWHALGTTRKRAREIRRRWYNQ